MKRRRFVFTSLDLGAWRRSLRQWPALTLTVACAALLTSSFLGAAPRSLEQAAGDDLRDAIASATPEQRNIRFEARTRIGAGSNPDPFNYVNRRGELLFETNVPEAIAAIVSDQQYVVDSPRFSVSSFPDEDPGPFPTTFAFRYQEGIEDQFTVVDGALPEAREPVLLFRGSQCPEEPEVAETFEARDDVDCWVERTPVYEAAVTATTADDMMVSVGDSLTLTPDLLDGRWLQADPDQLDDRFVLIISGILELSDPELDFWYADTQLHRPRITENPDFRLVFAVGLMRPDRYRQLLRDVANVPNQYTWRYLVDPAEITGESAADLSIEIEKIAPGGVQTITQLPRVIEEHLEQRSVTVSLLSTVTVALLVAALATTFVVELLIAVRHRRTTALAIDRGASRLQVLTNAARSGVVAVVPAAMVGWVIAWRWLPETASATPLVIVVIFTALAVAASIAAVRWAEDAGREDRFVASVTTHPGRLVLEGLVVVLAIGAVVLLRRRASTLERNTLADFDPLLAIAPALVAAAAGVVALRLIGPIMSGVARSAARHRGLVAFVGARRVTIQPVATRFPILVILLAVSTAVFSAAVAGSLTNAQRDASWQRIGADYRIETVNTDVPIRLPDDRARLAMASPVAAGRTLSDAAIITEEATTRVGVTALDLEAYAAIADGSGVDLPMLEPLFDRDATGTPEDPISAIVSRRWPGTRPLRVGDTFIVGHGAVAPTYVVEAVVPRFPGVDELLAFVVIDRPTLERIAGARTAQPSFALGSGSEARGRAIVDAVASEVPFARVTSRHDELDEIAGDPFGLWVDRILRWLFALSVAFAVVGAVSALAIAAADRRRDVGLLRTLGLTSRQAVTLTGIEQIPTVVVGTVAGAAAGIGITRLLDPALRVGVLAGGSSDAGVTIDVWAILVVGFVLVSLLAGSLVISVVAQRHTDSAKILRVGDD